GRVVEERGQDSARPEEMRRLAHGANDERECALLAHAQHGEHGNDGREDAREQDRHLLDRLPGELVLLANAPRRRPPGGPQHEEEDRVAHQVLHLLRDAEDRDLTEVHGPGEDDGGQHAAEEEDVVPALHPDRLAGPGRPCAQERVLAAHQWRSKSRYAPRTAPAVNSISFQIAKVQKNGTPWRKPRKSGGSPSGVSAPPMLATRKMKNTTVCARCRRSRLARSSGRTRSMAAPVVPTHEASSVPISMRVPFTQGVPRSPPRT